MKLAVWLVVMTAVMGLLGRSRVAARPAGDSRRLRYPKSVLVVGLVVGGTFFAIAGLVLAFPGKDGTPLMAAGFAAFGLLSFGILAEYFRVYAELRDDGLAYHTLTGRQGTFTWKQVTRVDYSPVNRWFLIEIEGDVKVRLSCLMMGLPELAREVLAHAPQDRIEGTTLLLLHRTAQGDPPRLRL